MPFIKKNKNAFISCWFYVFAILVAFISPYFLPILSSPGVFNTLAVAMLVILILVGIFFGFRSIKANESTWAGQLVVIAGGVILVAPLLLYVWGARH